MKTVHVTNEPYCVTKRGRVLSGKPVVFSIPIDFCIEFWNSTFSPVLEYTEGIFLTVSARAFQWCKPWMLAAFVLELFKFFLLPTQLGHTIVYDRKRKLTLNFMCYLYSFLC